MISYDKFQLSLARLQEQHSNYVRLGPSVPEATRDAYAESVIQRFETCYDCMWKVLKRYLVDSLGIPDVPNSPKPILRRAFENDLLDGPMERWLDYAQRRVGTSHDYSLTKAEDCLAIVGSFIADAIALHETLTGHAWDRTAI